MMQKISIPNEEIKGLLTGEKKFYPKYTTQLMNLANQNAQGTRPKIVGQMSDLIQEFAGTSFTEWDQWYKEKYPTSIDIATTKVLGMIQQLKESLEKIDRDLVKQWLEELIILKTYSGLKFQEVILKRISAAKSVPYKLADKTEERLGIDGYIGSTPVSIKPFTYKNMSLSERIDPTIIFYEKRKNCLYVEFDL